MRNPMIIAACLILAWTSCAFASGPCGEVAIEGYCDGGTRVYCNGADVVTETCAACCGWTGQKYNCLESCPAPLSKSKTAADEDRSPRVRTMILELMIEQQWNVKQHKKQLAGHLPDNYWIDDTGVVHRK